MSDKIVLSLDSDDLTITKDSYVEKLGSVETAFMTEAGTKNRLITRTGIYGLSVSYKGDESEKVILDAAVQASSLTVTVWDETAAATTTHTMYIDPGSYSSTLLYEDSNHRYYSFSFELVEF